MSSISRRTCSSVRRSAALAPAGTASASANARDRRAKDMVASSGRIDRRLIAIQPVERLLDHVEPRDAMPGVVKQITLVGPGRREGFEHRPLGSGLGEEEIEATV